MKGSVILAEKPMFCMALAEARPSHYENGMALQLVFNQASDNTCEIPERHIWKVI